MIYLADVTHLRLILTFTRFLKFLLCNFSQSIHTISTEEYFRHSNFGSDNIHMNC